ncbi:MAG: hypothetical protein ACKN9W_07160, partial [Methylococcus sp.]
MCHITWSYEPYAVFLLQGISQAAVLAIYFFGLYFAVSDLFNHLEGIVRMKITKTTSRYALAMLAGILFS